MGDDELTESAPPPAAAGEAADVAVATPEGDEAETVEQAETKVLTDLEVMQGERDNYLDALQRLQADFANYRRRMEKAQTEIVARAAQSLVEKLLPVLDAADLAIAHGPNADVAQVAGLLMDTLIKEGLAGVDPKPGDPFDPTEHDAVAHEPGEGDPEIADLLRPGYRWKGTLLRPAMVKVRG